MDVTFPKSRIIYRGVAFTTGRRQGHDVIIAHGSVPAGASLIGGETAGNQVVFPASYENMLVWDRILSPAPRLIAVNQSGYLSGFGAGNRIVLSVSDLANLSDQTTLGGWDGIYQSLVRSTVPFWFIQQSIVRELIPQGVDPRRYPGIGHTGGYGPREFLRAGLFAFASLGGYSDDVLPIGADADHAIVTGYDEESLQRSLDFNILAMSEARHYTKFTVDTSHLFDFPVTLNPSEERRLLATFHGRRFHIENIVPGERVFDYTFDDDEIMRLGRKYWRACTVHKILYDHAAALRRGLPFDYELSLDETPEPTPARDLLLYMVMLYEVMGVPAGGVASAGPNIGFIKRHDFEGDLHRDLYPQVNACSSVLHHFGAMLSVHSADGVRASTGKGPGVDAVLKAATGGHCELKVADVYQEVLWQVLATSPLLAERELFLEAWRRTFQAARTLAELYENELKNRETRDVQRMLSSPKGQETIIRRFGEPALLLAQGTIGYGLPVFRLAAELTPKTDPDRPDPHEELFRRFMFLTYRDLRPLIFRAVTHEGWQRLTAAIEEATMVRLRAMDWVKSR